MSQTIAFTLSAAPAPAVLLVSLVGFDGAQSRRLQALLDECSALNARWRVTQQGTSDLWIVNGAKARSLGAGLVEVAGPAPLRLRPAEMPHPVAFTEPLNDGVCTSHRFDPSSMQSLNVLLTQLGRWLSPRLVQQALVAHLIANGASFTSANVFQVQHGERLIASIDLRGETGVAADATPADVMSAHWVLEEKDDAFLPPGFRIAATQQVLWQFANRSDDIPVLPARYSRLPIHLRRMPQLPPREFSDRQLRILRELAYGPHTVAELAQRVAAGVQVLKRDLAALYLIGAITCDPGRSRVAREKRRGADMPQNDPSVIGAQPANVAELTAPGFARS